MAGGVAEGSESVTASIAPSPAYSVDSANDSATVIITDSTTPVGTGLLARHYDHGNATSTHAANFGDAANYAYVRAGTDPNFTGTAVISPTGLSSTRLEALLTALTPNTTQVRLSFLAGNLNTAVYNHQTYVVTAKTAFSFTVALPPGAGLPASSTSTCNFSIQPFHPSLVERVDPVVNNDWIYGTPNAVTILPMNSPDNFSSVWETYLAPTTAGSYIFQLDADDKARVLLDLDRNGTFEAGEQILEHGWDGAATPGNGRNLQAERGPDFSRYPHLQASATRCGWSKSTRLATPAAACSGIPQARALPTSRRPISSRIRRPIPIATPPATW